MNCIIIPKWGISLLKFSELYSITQLISMKVTNELFKKHNGTWHQRHTESLSAGQRIADSVARSMGSWSFIITQSVVVLCWMSLNMIGYARHWDPYPFILLNLLFSTQAAYAAPIIMMAQSRQSERDREQALADYQTNTEAKKEIEALQTKLNQIEIEKLDKLIEMVNQLALK
jgi:uncharacterized membrane protein